MKKKKEDKKKKEEFKDKLKVRNSRKVYIPIYIMIIVLVITLVYIKYSGNQLNDLALKLVLAFSLILLIATEIHRLGNSYEINSNSIIHRTGYLTIVSSRSEFGAISDSYVKQNPWKRIFSYGDVVIHLYSKENRSIIKNINNPLKFVDFLQDKMVRAGGGRGR